MIKNLIEKFRYDENSPSGLVWANDRRSGKDLRILHAKAGSVAGSINNEGYWMVWDLHLQKSVGCHRVVFELVSGQKIPEGVEVDHIDGNRQNNRFSNLRLVTDAQNARNQKLKSNSATGVVGVYWQENLCTTYAVSTWTDLSGKRFKKYFSVLKLGLLRAFAEAVKCREDAILFLNTQGAGYSQRHGK